MSDERETIRDLVGEATVKTVTHQRSEDTVPVDLTPLARQMLHATEGGKRPYLFVLDGMDAGNQIPLEARPIVIGRGPGCDVFLRDDGISRRHARVEFVRPNRVVVEDLESTNGTYVGGKRIAKATLKVGEKVLFGRRTMLRFMLEDALDRLYEQEMYNAATRDRLTGIHNLNYIKDRISANLAFAVRHGVPLTVVVFDIDHLGEVNRAYGHQTGDQVLVSISQKVSEMIREEDVLGRMDGGEFVIVSLGADHTGGRTGAERIREEIAGRAIRALGKKSEMIHVTASFGVATLRKGANADWEKLIVTARENLAMAKQNGHNRVISSQII